MANGIVKWFNDRKGYGFIAPEGGEAEIFVHYTSIAGNGFKTLSPGEAVEFDEAPGPRGPQAVNVTRRGPRVAPPIPAPAPRAHKETPR
ncbi:MAG: cold shock domain-containing protein [Candidatus Aureabacteria bacterium]|mgnify:FL=1|jgi:CspA family cold shock protein|nr:cold shock domain-containing protein [Candidatus Auribacterota bacterium]NLW94920.1 cold shock domain-containing protein [Chlamydiota bacterium]